MKALLLALLLLPGAAHADDRETLYLFLHAVDWAQTRNIARNPERWHEETNLVLGRHPSVDRVDAYFALTGAAHVYLSKATWLPRAWRVTFQDVTIGVQLATVSHNYRLGLSAKF